MKVAQQGRKRIPSEDERCIHSLVGRWTPGSELRGSHCGEVHLASEREGGSQLGALEGWAMQGKVGSEVHVAEASGEFGGC